MKTGQGFLLVFSITSHSSLNELSELREQIIRIKDDENVPIVIVGNKSDLEEDRVVTRQKAFSVSQSWGNAPYYETSARRRGKLRQTPFFFCTMRRKQDGEGQFHEESENRQLQQKCGIGGLKCAMK
jgi:Ras-related protein Rap-1B